jgi:protein involved in ribonucleotide reduction
MFFSFKDICAGWRKMQRSLLVTTARIGLLSAMAGGGWVEAGDTIYFRDGMRTVCEGNALEKGDEVHCEYEGGLLVYRKSDVERIEKGRSVEPELDAKNLQEAAPQPAAVTPSLPPPTPQIASPVSPPPISPSKPPGIAFYDPRRPQKYWTSETGRHDTFRDAILALSEEFNRPAAWIEENMGDSNDLNNIRETLAMRISESSAASANPVAATETTVEFYNPRRAKKYMTSPDARHDSFQEAVDALARDFDMPADWVEQNMGDSNDVDRIRKNLKKSAQEARMVR